MRPAVCTLSTAGVALELLTGYVETIEVPGDHETVPWPPNVQHVADALRSQLA